MEDLQEKLNRLDKGLGGIIMLVVPAEKIDTASNLITKYTKEFYDRIKSYYEMQDPINVEEINKGFNPFVANIMSVVETLGVTKSQWKSVRRLILNELYSVRDEIILGGNNVDV